MCDRCHKIHDCYAESAQTTPVYPSKSSDLLERQAALKAIADEPEYPDAEEFSEKVKSAIEEGFDVDSVLAGALADMVIAIARISVKEAKDGITARVEAL